MGMEDFWEQLPTGKEDKPLLFEMGPLEYDFHDIDGLYFMLGIGFCLTQDRTQPLELSLLDDRINWVVQGNCGMGLGCKGSCSKQ